jgi:hypothetical protein
MGQGELGEGATILGFPGSVSVSKTTATVEGATILGFSGGRHYQAVNPIPR